MSIPIPPRKKENYYIFADSIERFALITREQFARNYYLDESSIKTNAKGEWFAKMYKYLDL